MFLLNEHEIFLLTFLFKGHFSYRNNIFLSIIELIFFSKLVVTDYNKPTAPALLIISYKQV